MTTLRTQINKRHMRIWRRNCLRIFLRVEGIAAILFLFSHWPVMVLFLSIKNVVQIRLTLFIYYILLKFKHVMRIIPTTGCCDVCACF